MHDFFFDENKQLRDCRFGARPFGAEPGKLVLPFQVPLRGKVEHAGKKRPQAITAEQLSLDCVNDDHVQFFASD